MRPIADANAGWPCDILEELFDWIQSQCQGLLGNLKLVKM